MTDDNETMILPESLTAEIWLTFAARYGNTWVSQYGADPAGFASREWRSTLAGLSGEQVRAGFSADVLRGADWPPSSTVFRAMCLSIPSLANARYWFDHGEKDDFDRTVAQFLNVYGYDNAAGPRQDRMFREAYELAKAHLVGGGEPPPKPVIAIAPPPPPPPKPPSPEQQSRVRALMAELSAKLSMP